MTMFVSNGLNLTEIIVNGYKFTTDSQAMFQQRMFGWLEMER